MHIPGLRVAVIAAMVSRVLAFGIGLAAVVAVGYARELPPPKLVG